MVKLAVGLYKKSLCDSDARKALALAIFLKEKCGKPTIYDYSPRMIAEMSDLSVIVVKKRIEKMQEMGLISLCGKHNQHLILNKTRNTLYANISLDKIDKTNVKDIEMGLKALYIVYIQSQKDYVRNILNMRNEAEKKTYLSKSEYRNFKKAKKFCNKCGINTFIDNGISYNKISRDLNISKSTVSELIEYGEKHNMFIKSNQFEEIMSFNKCSEAYDYLKNNFEGRMRMIKKENKYIICLVSSNKYILLSSSNDIVSQ